MGPPFLLPWPHLWYHWVRGASYNSWNSPGSFIINFVAPFMKELEGSPKLSSGDGWNPPNKLIQSEQDFWCINADPLFKTWAFFIIPQNKRNSNFLQEFLQPFLCTPSYLNTLPSREVACNHKGVEWVIKLTWEHRTPGEFCSLGVCPVMFEDDLGKA